MTFPQTCSVAISGEPDRYGKPTKSTTTTPACFKEVCQKTIVKPDGSLVCTSYRYFINAALDPTVQYLVDDRTILSMAPIQNLLGVIYGTEVYT
jgi:hypothetical protein